MIQTCNVIKCFHCPHFSSRNFISITFFFPLFLKHFPLNMVITILGFCGLHLSTDFFQQLNSFANWSCWNSSPSFRYTSSCPTLLLLGVHYCKRIIKTYSLPLLVQLPVSRAFCIFRYLHCILEWFSTAITSLLRTQTINFIANEDIAGFVQTNRIIYSHFKPQPVVNNPTSFSCDYIRGLSSR